MRVWLPAPRLPVRVSKWALGLVVLCCQVWLRLAVCGRATCVLQRPQIRFGLRIVHAVEQEPPVGRPVVGTLLAVALQQRFLAPCSAGVLLIEIERTSPVGGEDKPAPVRRPDGPE